MKIALFQPDMAANAAASIRLAACFGLPIAIIEPLGFVWDDRRLRRVGMDYLGKARIERWASFQAFEQARRDEGRRLVLLTTKAEISFHRAAYRADDILLAGRESAGVPDDVHALADLRVRLPMADGVRSLNVVTALAMVTGEALRQTDGFPGA
ncbi:MAG: TrmH family RNA methyltransferase [Alphaproteobacteria bacterium]